MLVRYPLILILLTLLGSTGLKAQILFSPIEMTNRPLGSLNDASSTGWNPSLLGTDPGGYELLLSLPYGDRFSFAGKPYAAFAKAGPFGGGLITLFDDSVAAGMLALPKQYFVGFGFPIAEESFWIGASNRWLDAGGFLKSGEISVSATMHPFEHLLASLTVSNITSNNDNGIGFNGNAAYRFADWGTIYGTTRYDKADTLFGYEPFRAGLGISLGIFDNQLRLSGQYDLTRSSIRAGVELMYAGSSANVGGGTIGEISRSTGLLGGLLLVRYASTDNDLDAGISDALATTGRNRRGWAPERAYTPDELYYRVPTNDALPSPTALIRPCDGTGMEFDSPSGLASVLSASGAPYTELTSKLRELSPNPHDLYKAIRQEYYSTRIRNAELQSSDSLALLTRQGHSIGIQAVNAEKFPEVSLLLQVTDNAGRNVRGLGLNDFRFRDSLMKITSVRPIDSSFNVPVDVVIILDCSGSMRDEINSVRANVQSFVNSMATRGADYHIGGVLYGGMIYDTLHPTADFDRFKKFMVKADAIGNDEITSLAIKAATQMNFRPNSQRLFILITDDWAIQDNARLNEPDLTQMLWDTHARLYSIGNPCNNNGAVMTRLSLGREYNINAPFNSVLDDIGADVTTIYQLTYESRMKEAAPKVTLMRGRLRDVTGRPAPVPLWLSNGGNRIAVAVNGTTGEYEIEIAEGLSYSAEASGDRYLPLSETVDLTAVRQGDTVVRDFTLRIRPTTLMGRVQDEQGAPVSAEVRVEDAITGERLVSVRSGADGHYSTPIPEGHSLRVSAINPNYVPNVVEIDAGTVSRQRDLTQDLNVTSIEAAIATGATFKVRNIFFDFAKWDLKPESFIEIDRLAALMAEYPTIKVEIGAHTDAIGSDRDNQILSENRAKSVVRYLVDKGVAQERLRAHGYGKQVPIAPNDTDEGRALNRRVEFKLVR